MFSYFLSSFFHDYFLSFPCFVLFWTELYFSFSISPISGALFPYYDRLGLVGIVVAAEQNEKSTLKWNEASCFVGYRASVCNLQLWKLEVNKCKRELLLCNFFQLFIFKIISIYFFPFTIYFNQTSLSISCISKSF